MSEVKEEMQARPYDECRELRREKMDLEQCLARIERQLAEAQRQCQDMETKLHNECQAHDRTRKQLAEARKQIEQMKCCENCANSGSNHSVAPLKHCSRITVCMTAETHLHTDQWKLKGAK